jgi:hypothetical protein
MEYLNAFVAKNVQTAKVLADNKSKFILVHSASGFKHSIKEIFQDPTLSSRLTDTKALGETKTLDAFHQMLKNEPTRAYYGYKHVEKANESDAIDILLISDSLFRSKEISERKKYVNIVDRVKENNGTVKIFSSLHVSGEQLMQLTGIAAILRFPMPELEDIESSDESDDDEKSSKVDKQEPKETSLDGDNYSDESEESYASKPTTCTIPSSTKTDNAIQKANFYLNDESSQSTVSIASTASKSEISSNLSKTLTQADSSASFSATMAATNITTATTTASSTKKSNKKSKKTNKESNRTRYNEDEDYYDDQDYYDAYDY